VAIYGWRTREKAAWQPARPVDGAFPMLASALAIAHHIPAMA